MADDTGSGAAREAEDSIEVFAADLRDLRALAGEPTLAALGARTGISKSVISVALSGRGLPTERTVMKLVAELGGAPAEWRLRRAALDPRSAPPITEADALPSAEPESDSRAPEVASAESSSETGARDPDSQRPAGRRFSVLQTGLIAACVAVVAAAATSLVWGALTLGGQARAATPENREGPYLTAANGVDPMRTACKEDAVIAADDARLGNQVHVQLLYSNDCLAVWGRITRYDGKNDGNSMSMRVWPADDPQSSRNQERSDQGLQSLYTPMIIEPDAEARICGVATISVDGETVELGPPLCV